MIPQSFIQDLLNRIDIVTVVENHVQLKKAGANLLGLCPFHSEKTPSFTVSPVKQFYHCFGCGKNGTAIGFLMDYAGLGFVEAVHELANSAGMVVPDDDQRFTPEQRAEKKAVSLAHAEIMAQADRFYRRQLRQAEPAINYLKDRGVSGEIAARFGLGYAPDNREGLKTVFDDYAASELQEAGLVIERDADAGMSSSASRYDRFRDRIMFPIRNSKGQVIGFGARVINKGEPKYLNSPETPLFQKGNELYGLFEARQDIRNAGYVLVVEGYMDVVALAQLGFPQVVATLGTACTPVQVQKLMRQTDLVVFAFDGDRAGQSAARRALEASLPYVTDNKSVRFLFLPPEHDPDSFVREYGATAFEKEIGNAVPFSEFLFQEITKGNDLGTLEGRARAQYMAKPLLQAIQPSALRLQIVRKLAELTQTAGDELEALLGLSRPAAKKQRFQPRSSRPQIVGLGRQVIRLLLMYPELVQELEEEARSAIEQFDADDAQMVSDIVNAVHAIGENVGFAALTEYFRLSGRNYEQLIAEVMSGYDFDLAAARRQLTDSLRQIRIRLITEELKNLMESGQALENRQYVLDLQNEQRLLQQQIIEDSAKP
ncbi:DNA primase [Oxalobacter sp. OttesenSCG-928-P03]|nr:DNA primase [Oxalobacter sp. OttesenSCG-928-P03]